MPASTNRLPRWADLCTTDFAGFDPELALAVLPVAATEQHGPHLPLSVDTDLVEGILDAAAPHVPSTVPVYVLPTQAVGLSPEHQRFAGTLSLRPETVIRLWIDLAACVARAGVRKLVLFNSHGGHTGIMDVVGRELRSQHDMLVYGVSWFNLPMQDEHGQDVYARFSAEEHRYGIHAGQIETAMMLALKPDRVRMSRAQDFPSTSKDRAALYPILGNGRSAKLSWQMQDYHPEGAVGNAAAATSEDGHALIQAAGRSLAQMLQEVSRLPLSTLVERPHRPGTQA